MSILTFLASRFVAGKHVSEAVEAVRQLNEQGLLASLNFLGEEVKDSAQAQAATQEYILLLRKIAEAEVDCNISVKLTQMGLGFDEELCRENLVRVLKEAARFKNFVRIDMESSAYTQKTLDLIYRVFPEHSNVGAVIQASLYRSEKDIEMLNRKKVRVRLCKGAYREPPKIAFQEKEKVNENYDFLAQKLLKEGYYPGLATHDDDRLYAAIDFAKSHGISSDRFEFQMLCGLRRSLWSRLLGEGYRVRIYVPYGTHWMPYFYRRLRERKENWMFVLKSLVKG
ncbi:MAG: proline dehydrogenase family protein [Elusimicrobia bacterium]|nr:proline dehydrogenase family protein [Elusimicrobiota bacterium]